MQRPKAPARSQFSFRCFFFIVERTTKRYQYTLPPVVYESGAHCVRVCARSRQPHTAQQNIVRFRTFSPRAVRPDWPGTHFRLTLFGGWSRKAFVCALAAAWHGAWSAEYGVAPLFQRRSRRFGKGICCWLFPEIEESACVRVWFRFGIGENCAVQPRELRLSRSRSIIL